MSSTKRGTDCSLDDSLTNIQWLCELESKTLLDGQQSPASRPSLTGDPSSINPYPKPSYSYATLILLAINSTLEKRMTLQDIYKWIEDNFPYYTKCKKAWKNSIRHNLSLHSFFLKAKRPSSLPGKGSYWSISPEGKENILKEVLKYQQPTINQDRGVQSQTKGLRPILPKPSDTMMPSAVSTVIGNSSMQVLTDGSVPGLHGNTIPVVILPTQVYMNMATKLASQTAVTATVTGMGIQMNQSYVPMTTESAPTPREGIIGEPLDDSNAMIKKPDENLSSKCTQTPFPGHHTVTVKLELDNNGDLLNKKAKMERSLPKNNNTSNDKMFAPQTKKSRTDKRKIQPNNRRPTQVKRSPLRTRPQPTLAAINSQTSDALSPGSIFCRNTPGKLSLMSPGKSIVTPTKDAGNRSLLASLWMSPIASLAYNSSSGFTPLNYGYNSGIFTPFRDRELDCGFILSPERVTSSNICSTPHQNGRKSRRLSFSRSDKTELESSWIDHQDSMF